MALPGRRRRRTLTGSAVQLGRPDDTFADRKGLPWQKRSLRYLDLIPELNYASRFYARMLKQLRLFPATRQSNGQLVAIESGPPVDLLNRIQDASGGRAQILANYGRLMFTTGEGNLFGHDLETEDEAWVFIWNDEIEVEKNKEKEVTKYVWMPNPQERREYGPEDAVVYKLWTPHPRRSGEADSPMRPIVEGDIAEELISLTRAVSATAVSRTTNGVLLIPQEISPQPVEPDGDEDPAEVPFIEELGLHLEAQKENANSAAARAPYLLEAAYDYLDQIRMVKLHEPAEDYLERELRKEAVERIARGVDFPPEALLGIGTTNHWAALQILMDMWRSHGAPIAQQLCDDLASVYLRPALREEEYEAWADVVIAYDESQVVVKPDRSSDAQVALKEGAIGHSGFRKMLNIPEDFAPTEEEKEWMLELRSGGDADEPQEEERDQSSDPEDGPEQPGPEGDSGRRTRQTQSVSSPAIREIGAIDSALMRCRELAGIRIKQKERHCPECIEQVRGLPNSIVAATIGQEMLKQMGLANTIALVNGGADGLRSVLAEYGYLPPQIDTLCEMVEIYASRTLFDTRFPELPEAFTNHLRVLTEVAA